VILIVDVVVQSHSREEDGKYSYSLLHVAVGVVASILVHITRYDCVILHIVFEYVGNTPWSINLIHTYLKKWWPGGKPHADNLLHQSSDTLFTGLGWIVSYHERGSTGSHHTSRAAVQHSPFA